MLYDDLSGPIPRRADGEPPACNELTDTTLTDTTGRTMSGLTFSARQFPQHPVEWLHEIDDAYRDAHETLPFMPLVGVMPSENKLFHLAPRVAVKFRGLPLPGLIPPRRLRCRAMLHRKNWQEVLLMILTLRLLFATLPATLGWAL